MPQSIFGGNGGHLTLTHLQVALFFGDDKPMECLVNLHKLFQMEEAALVRSSTVSGGSAGGAASSGGSGKSSKVGGRSSHKASKSHSFLSRDSHSGSSTSLSKAVKSGSSSAAAAAQNMIQKTGNSVRARLMKMSLHTDSCQC